MKRIASAAFFVVLWSFCCANQQTNEFRTNDGFSLFLPEGWVEIPKPEIEKWADEKARKYPDVKKVVPDYAYQPINQKIFEYPNILVLIARTGKATSAELDTWRRIDTSIGEGGKRYPNLDSLRVMKLGDSLYDADNQILWMHQTNNVQGPGGIDVTSAFKLTQYGGIVVQWYSRRENFPSSLKTFISVALDIRVDPEFQYKADSNQATVVTQNHPPAAPKSKGIGDWLVEIIGGFGFVFIISRLLYFLILRRVNQPIKSLISDFSPFGLVFIIGTYDFVTALIIYGIPIIILLIIDLTSWRANLKKNRMDSNPDARASDG